MFAEYRLVTNGVVCMADLQSGNIPEAFVSPTTIDYLPKTEITHLDAYWRALNYLSVGQIYLMGNPC